MKILVTGASGYVGTHLAPYFEERGHTVVRTDLPSVDLLERSGLEDFDAVVHLAANTKNPGTHNDFTENVAMLATVIDALPDVPILLASTLLATEGGTHYSDSKLACEAMLDGGDTVLRLGNVYGGTHVSDTHLFPTLARVRAEGVPFPLNGDGSTVRDYVHIDDVCSAFLLALEEGHAGLYEVGTGQGHSVLDILDGYPTTSRPGRQEQPYVVSNPLNWLPDWKPTRFLEKHDA